jgi:O-antigen chain-terminating methyltransferase
MYWIDENCRPLKPHFSQQALNYPVAKRLTRGGYRSLLISGVSGATIDLVNVANLLGLTVCIFLTEQDIKNLSAAQAQHQKWVTFCLQQCASIFVPEGLAVEAQGLAVSSLLSTVAETSQLTIPKTHQARREWFDYTVYELILRDHPLLSRMQRPYARHFLECESVLDVGCGAGIFLDVLKSEGVSATGVERNQDLVAQGQSMGLNIVCDDALDYLAANNEQFDGVYCSHFVEHLPVDAVETLLKSLASTVVPGGIVVLVFPDPESIRSQLLGFWRDPEHVRFYHPELVQTMALAYGLDCEWSSYDEAPHEVASFSVDPPEWALSAAPAPKKPKLWQKLLRRLGVATRFDLASTAAELDRLRQANALLRERTEQLWAVNRTWAWEDNVVLKLRKRGAKPAC